MRTERAKRAEGLHAVSLSAELESDVQWSLMIDCLQHLEPEFTIYIKTYLGIKTIWAKRWASGVLEEFWMVDFELAPLNRLKELTRCERKEKNNNRCQIIWSRFCSSVADFGLN